MIKVGRFGLAMVATVGFGLVVGNSAFAEDFSSDGAAAAPAAVTEFSVNQAVNVNVNAVVLGVHTNSAQPTVLSYNPNIPIVNIQPIVTSGQRPLVVGGAPCTVTIYGVDAAGNLYNISSAAWMSPPQVVQWGPITSGPPMPGNLSNSQLTAFIHSSVLDLGYSTVVNSPGKIVGMSFTEQAPANSVDTVSNIQVTSVVVMDNGSGGWSFNDSVSTVAAGTVVTPASSYDILLEVPGNPPYTTKILNVPATSIAPAS